MLSMGRTAADQNCTQMWRMGRGGRHCYLQRQIPNCWSQGGRVLEESSCSLGSNNPAGKLRSSNSRRRFRRCKAYMTASAAHRLCYANRFLLGIQYKQTHQRRLLSRSHIAHRQNLSIRYACARHAARCQARGCCGVPATARRACRTMAAPALLVVPYPHS